MVIYRSFYDAIIDLPEQNQLEVWNAIHSFGFDGIEPELKGLSKTMFTLIRPQIEANNRKAEIGKANGEKGGKFGKLGGRPPKEKPANNPQETPIEGFEITPKKPANVNDNVNVNVNDNKNNNGNSQLGFVRPTAWWTSATKQSFSEKVFKEFQNLYPKAFLQKFIDYYSQEHVNGGISINHEMKFSLESKLRDWYNDPKTKERYPQSTIKRNKPLL